MSIIPLVAACFLGEGPFKRCFCHCSYISTVSLKWFLSSASFVWSDILTTLSSTFMLTSINSAISLSILPYDYNGALQVTHLLLVFAKREPQRPCLCFVFHRKISEPLNHSFKYLDQRDSDPLLDPFFEMLSWRSSPLPSLCSYISWYVDNH